MYRAQGITDEENANLLILCRKMFLLQYALEVKMGEKTRLETTLKVKFELFEDFFKKLLFRKKKQG